jgi:hypothetical protein
VLDRIIHVRGLLTEHACICTCSSSALEHVLYSMASCVIGKGGSKLSANLLLSKCIAAVAVFLRRSSAAR